MVIDVGEGVPEEGCAADCEYFESSGSGRRSAYLATVASIPGHMNTVLAMALPFLPYFIGLPPYNLNNLAASLAFVPVTYAL